MEQNKLSHFFDKSVNCVKKTIAFFDRILNKIISQVHFLDPRTNTKQRVLTAIVLIPVALYAIFGAKEIFILLTLIIAILMTAEWLDMIKSAEGKEQQRWRTLGFFYILIPLYCTIKIRFHSSHASEILLWMFAVIWVTDIFAFFAGRILGGAKLAPRISPNKTWSGLIGGVVASALIGFMSSILFSGGIVFFTFMSIILSLVEQASDLLESKFKRIFGVKDSGNIIPGHGGVLDRLDGMMLVAPVVLFLITVFPNKF